MSANEAPEWECTRCGSADGWWAREPRSICYPCERELEDIRRAVEHEEQMAEFRKQDRRRAIRDGLIECAAGGVQAVAVAIVCDHVAEVTAGVAFAVGVAVALARRPRRGTFG